MLTLRGQLFVITFLAASVSLSSCAAGDEQAKFHKPEQTGKLQQRAINEASGLAASTRNKGVLWAHNDSGDTARVFAMDVKGRHLGIYNITGAGARDWEDMTLGPGPADDVSYLYMGDIGDNKAGRSSIVVYRVPEPKVSVSQTPVNTRISGVERICLAYPDGPRDAEVLMIDPLTKDLYVVSKREIKSRVYRSAYPQSTSKTNVMEYLGELPWGWATGGDISPDGSEIIIRGYGGASLWQRPAGGTIWEALKTTPCKIPIASEKQGESICFDATGENYFTVSEGNFPALFFYKRIVNKPLPEKNAKRDGAQTRAEK